MRSFENANPLALAVYFLSVSGISMFCMNPLLLFLSLTGAVLYYFVRSGRKRMKSHLWSLGLFLVLVVLNPLVSHNGVTVLFVLNHNPVTLEAAVYGIAAAGMILAVLYWFRSFTEIMTSDKLLYLFGKFSPKLALVLSMGLRYVPLFTRQAQKIGQTQTALGLYKDDNLIDRFRGGMRIFDVLVTWGLENGIITADSMTARGYGAFFHLPFPPFGHCFAHFHSISARCDRSCHRKRIDGFYLLSRDLSRRIFPYCPCRVHCLRDSDSHSHHS